MGTRTHLKKASHLLSDDSEAHVEPISQMCSMVTRTVKGDVVWGQVFACGGTPNDHYNQIEVVLTAMRERPFMFRRDR